MQLFLFKNGSINLKYQCESARAGGEQPILRVSENSRFIDLSMYTSDDSVSTVVAVKSDVTLDICTRDV